MGLEVDRFEGEVDEDLMCLLCKKVLEEPTSSECGHLFCRECLLSASGKRMGCPNCGQALKKHSPTAGGGEEEALAERLGKMSIRCTHKSAGCTETVPLTELVRHADSECDYRPVRCENTGCGISCPHSALEDHMDRCDHRIVECKVCKARLPRKDMPAHQAVRRCFEELNKRHRVTSARQIKSELRDHRMAMLHRRHQTVHYTIQSDMYNIVPCVWVSGCVCCRNALSNSVISPRFNLGHITASDVRPFTL